MKRLWYHCSERYHGEQFTATRTHRIKHAAENEPLTPRLCVCPWIAACFSTRLFTRSVHVYRTQRFYRGIKPKGVWDAVITGERWLVPPVTLDHILTIPVDIVGRINCAILLYHQTTKSSSNLRLRVMQYARAIEVLNFSTARELQLIETMRKLLKLDHVDPEDYILTRAQRKLNKKLF